MVASLFINHCFLIRKLNEVSVVVGWRKALLFAVMILYVASRRNRGRSRSTIIPPEICRHATGRRRRGSCCDSKSHRWHTISLLNPLRFKKAREGSSTPSQIRPGCSRAWGPCWFRPRGTNGGEIGWLGEGIQPLCLQCVQMESRLGLPHQLKLRFGQGVRLMARLQRTDYLGELSVLYHNEHNLPSCRVKRLSI